MIWRKDHRRASNPDVGSSPPPFRPLYYQDNEDPIVWVCSRVRIYHNGTLYSDLGWTDDVELWNFEWPYTNVASHNSTVNVTTTIDIQTKGRFQPWQIVLEKSLAASSGTTVSTDTLTFSPGATQTFNYSTALNTTLTITNAMFLIPAEGF